MKKRKAKRIESSNDAEIQNAEDKLERTKTVAMLKLIANIIVKMTFYKYYSQDKNREQPKWFKISYLIKMLKKLNLVGYRTC